AQKVAYQEDIEATGPTFDSMKIENGKVRVRFTHAQGLRIAAPPAENLTPSTTQPTALKGFSLAGDDHRFIWANAVIDADSVIVSSDKVPTPVAVRYGWADNPQPNLYNGALLPTIPFRSDDWSE